MGRLNGVDARGIRPDCLLVRPSVALCCNDARVAQDLLQHGEFSAGF